MKISRIRWVFYALWATDTTSLCWWLYRLKAPPVCYFLALTMGIWGVVLSWAWLRASAPEGK